MASRIAEAYVQIVPRIDGIGSGLTKGLSGEMGVAGEKGAAGFATGFKKVLGPAIALAAVAAIGSFVKSSIEAGEKAATANARIEQIATSMGLFGEETEAVTKRLVDLATQQALATGVDQNAIKATQAKLLTFKELAATADETGGAFDRATTAAVDLAAAGFGSAESNAVQLGKALNDPIKGITALTRSGISFTEQEKEKIKTLVASGQVLEAQNLILEAIETQVGGTALATANASDRMNVAFGLLTEKVGLALLPVFNALADFVINDLIPGLEGIFNFIQDNIVVIGTFVGVLGTLLIAFNAVRIATGAWAIAQGILNVVLSLNPIGLIIIAIAALVAAIVFVATKTTFFQDTWKKMTEFVKKAWDSVVKFFDDTVKSIISFFASIPKAITDIFRGAANWLIQTGKDIMEGLLNGLKSMFNNVVNFIGGIGNSIANTFKNILGIKSPSTVFYRFGENIVEGLVDGVKNVSGTYEEAMEKLGTIGANTFVKTTTGALLDLTTLLDGYSSAFKDDATAEQKALGTALRSVGGAGLQGTLDKLLGQTTLTKGNRQVTISGTDLERASVQELLAQGYKLEKQPKGTVEKLIKQIGEATLPKKKKKMGTGGFVTGPIDALIGEAGPEVVIPLNRFEKMMGIDGKGGKTIIYNAAPNNSIDREQALFQAIKRAKVITGW